jgi:hypothetical protein
VPPAQRELDGRDCQLLDFERDWARHQGGKEAAIKERFGFSSTRYYKLLSRLIEEPAALDYDPLTVRRLRRRRQERERKRTERFGDARPSR